MSFFNSTQTKLSLFNQLFDFEPLFSELADAIIEEGDQSMCYFLNSWIDDKIKDEFDEFSWEDCQNMRYSSMSDGEFVEYAKELDIPIDKEALRDMLVYD